MLEKYRKDPRFTRYFDHKGKSKSPLDFEEKKDIMIAEMLNQIGWMDNTFEKDPNILTNLEDFRSKNFIYHPDYVKKEEYPSPWTSEEQHKELEELLKNTGKQIQKKYLPENYQVGDEIKYDPIMEQEQI